MSQSNIMASENHGPRQKRRSYVDLIIMFAVLGLHTTFFGFRRMNTSLGWDEDLKFGIDPNAPQSESVTENQSDRVFNTFDEIPQQMFIIFSKKVTWCQANKVASTSTKDYFLKISDGEVEIPEGARYGVHQANFQKVRGLPLQTQKRVKKNEDSYTQVLIVRNVVERFISGYLDKIIKECNEPVYDKTYVYNLYIKYGFSCEKHQDLEAFISFMETVPKMESHFNSQTSLCMLRTYHYTDIIYMDDNFDESLRDLSKRLGIDHPDADNKATRKNATGAKKKLAGIFKHNEEWIDRILKIFERDCRLLPKACEVDELRSAIASFEVPPLVE
jgi:hypothetical protein